MNPMVTVGVTGVILLSPLTFVPGCELIPPKVSSRHVGPGRPVARDRFAPVEIFLAGHDPGRPFAVLGDVEIQARSRNTSLLNLLDAARREARRLGGDAVVEVRAERVPHASRGACAGAPVARLTVTGTVVRW